MAIIANQEIIPPSSGTSRDVVEGLHEKTNASMSGGTRTKLGISKGPTKSGKAPWGVKWRSSSWFITTVVTLGVITDILTYTIVVPVLPYRLQSLNYTNISTLTSWLLFAYSIGIFICTLPVAYFFHKYPYRRSPLIFAVLALDVAVILFMTINTYWVMVLSRFIQGASSTVVWSVGFALICENVPEKNVGRQIGFAYSGVSVGMTIAPPIGGALYQHMGWHAPFVFCIIALTLDLILRLLVIEQKDLRQWEETSHTTTGSEQTRSEDEEQVRQAEVPPGQLEGMELSPWKVILTIGSSARGMTGFWVTFIYGLIIGIYEPSLTLRVQEVWNKESDFVGLVYLAAAAPTFFTGPIVGALADKYGAEFIMLPCLAFALPWLPLMILKKSLAGFIVLFALAEVALQCASGPAGLEVTIVARQTPGISEIHQFAAMNVAFAISTSIGAVVGGQMYDHLPSGWAAICWFALGLTAISLPFPFFFSGNKTLYRRMVHRGKSDEVEGGPAEDQRNAPERGDVAVPHD
ncbi:hypothetical protein I302_109069 [Kwoniella bestiolae CBS 10118]|uniref:Major facilitator superfamily (MFS) profile domain-containing protein n=1 Tax=Kwoniella bestiolae CBS 10118 TaxID=1296100 RepID=A0AAJ8MCK4_9TREE